MSSYPQSGEPDESVTHAIFECPPALQAWVLVGTPSHPDIFSVSNIYTNMNYFWRKCNIEDLEMDRDPYPLIIYYIGKRGIISYL